MPEYIPSIPVSLGTRSWLRFCLKHIQAFLGIMFSTGLILTERNNKCNGSSYQL